MRRTSQLKLPYTPPPTHTLSSSFKEFFEETANDEDDATINMLTKCLPSHQFKCIILSNVVYAILCLMAVRWILPSITAIHLLIFLLSVCLDEVYDRSAELKIKSGPCHLPSIPFSMISGK